MIYVSKAESLMTQPLLVAKNITLQVPIFQPSERKLLSNPSRFLADLYLSRTKRGTITILNEISFTLMPGDRLGLIGVNGAGKSTLLRILAGIYTPSAGQLEVNGKAKGLFDITMGMNPEATGLENIYLRGFQMGLNFKSIKQLVPEIVEFSELAEFIENPFNTYSTGMRMRLAFSISTMVAPDILLLDEWIGTGDAGFRAKVEGRMDSLLAQSRGLVLASHNTELMKGLCTHGLVLSKGRALFYGELSEALDIYNAQLKPKKKVGS